MRSLLDQIDLAEREYRQGMARVAERLNELGVLDLNAERAVMLVRLGDRRMTVGEIQARGVYRGTNVSYNLRQLIDDGYVRRAPRRSDRRVAEIQATEKGLCLVEALLGGAAEAA